MKRSIIALVAIASVFGYVGSGMAQEAQKRGLSTAQLLSALDKNSDGQIALDEVPEGRKAYFERLLTQLDTNGGKILDAAELAKNGGASDGGQKSPATAAPAAKSESAAVPNLLAVLDKDGDGKLSKDEIAGAAAALAALDQDKDGQLAPDELAAAKKPASAGGPSAQVTRYLEMKDKNKDGKLDAGELPASIADLIAQYDLDGDEKLDPNELAAALMAATANRKKS